MAVDSLPVLWHLQPSNFNEKARWALDYKRIPHRRYSPQPGTHMPIALTLTRRSVTFPVLQLDGRTIADSTRIVVALEERFPDPPLFPEDPAGRRRALDLEDFFDENLGPAVRRIGFWELVRDPEAVRLVARRLPPRAFGGMVLRRYGITERSAARAHLELKASLGLLEDALGGGDHLVGGRFTVADLAAAALLAPLVGPPELPYRDSAVRLPAGLERIAAELRSRPAGEWVLRTYARFRHGPP